MKAWISAFRLRTLPLSFSPILLGTLLAASHDGFRWSTALLAFLTTLFLQILSNLANDYGDGVKGTDNEERIGPARAIQTGAISQEAMKRALYITSVLSFLSGIGLMAVSLNSWQEWAIFLLMGLSAIWAAIQYTVGENAYGYKGLGDVFVLIFFGWMGTIGTYYLHTESLNWVIFLPATAVGFLAARVLNLNNMRDRITDERVGKRTLAVLLGDKLARVYHTFLLLTTIILSVAYVTLNPSNTYAWGFVILLFPILVMLTKVWKVTDPKQFDPMLKQTAISALFYAIIFGVGQLL